MCPDEVNSSPLLLRIASAKPCFHFISYLAICQNFFEAKQKSFFHGLPKLLPHLGLCFSSSGGCWSKNLSSPSGEPWANQPLQASFFSLMACILGCWAATSTNEVLKMSHLTLWPSLLHNAGENSSRGGSWRQHGQELRLCFNCVFPSSPPLLV